VTETSSPASPDLADGESREVKGSGAKPYVVTNTGGVYSCTCPAWRHQGLAIERRTCKHLKAVRGDAAELARVGAGDEAAAGAVATSASLAAYLSSATAEAGGAPALLLAHKWEQDVDPTGWWLSEKLDGVRAYWNGSKLVSRLGKTLWAPDWFLAALPPGMPLDGELFGGRKKFQQTVSIVRRQDKSDAWHGISYVVFDAPLHDAEFEGRLDAVASFVAAAGHAHVVAHAHARCKGLAHLHEELARVEALGGEGLMMRKPGSRYEAGRSTTLLKVKTFHDAEAIVTAHLPGAGKHAGRLGALQCDLPNGTRFSVGTGLRDAERDAPPPLGTIITFRYQELTPDGVPRFPSYVGVRDDVAWPPAKSPPAPAPSAAPPIVAGPPDAPSPAPAPAGRAMTRVFAKDGVRWEITLIPEGHTIRRRRGLAVKMTTTAFPSPAAAWRDADARIAAQRAEGWTEVTGEDA
jgi:DNA ligase 1